MVTYQFQHARKTKMTQINHTRHNLNQSIEAHNRLPYVYSVVRLSLGKKQWNMGLSSALKFGIVGVAGKQSGHY
jgi:hypothetical protein